MKFDEIYELPYPWFSSKLNIGPWSNTFPNIEGAVVTSTKNLMKKKMKNLFEDYQQDVPERTKVNTSYVGGSCLSLRAVEGHRAVVVKVYEVQNRSKSELVQNKQEKFQKKKIFSKKTFLVIKSLESE